MKGNWWRAIARTWRETTSLHFVRFAVCDSPLLIIDRKEGRSIIPAHSIFCCKVRRYENRDNHLLWHAYVSLCYNIVRDAKAMDPQRNGLSVTSRPLLTMRQQADDGAARASIQRDLLASIFIAVAAQKQASLRVIYQLWVICRFTNQVRTRCAETAERRMRGELKRWYGWASLDLNFCSHKLRLVDLEIYVCLSDIARSQKTAGRCDHWRDRWLALYTSAVCWVCQRWIPIQRQPIDCAAGLSL